MSIAKASIDICVARAAGRRFAADGTAGMCVGPKQTKVSIWRSRSTGVSIGKPRFRPVFPTNPGSILALGCAGRNPLFELRSVR